MTASQYAIRLIVAGILCGYRNRNRICHLTDGVALRFVLRTFSRMLDCGCLHRSIRAAETEVLPPPNAERHGAHGCIWQKPGTRARRVRVRRVEESFAQNLL